MTSITKKQFLLLTLVVLLVGYLGWLGYLGLRAEEPRRAIVSVEMMLNGDYLMPHLIGWPYYNKPPLFNWVMIPFFQLTGSISEWVVRLPSTLSLLLLAFINWRVLRRHLPPETALLSSLFLLTSADILFYGSVNTGEIDLFFALLVYLNILVVFVFLEKRKFLPLFLLSYLFMSLGFLTKGPVAVVFHGLTLITGLAYYRVFGQLFSWRHLAGIVVFVFLGGGYMWLLHDRGELTGFLLRQVKESTQRTGMESNLLDTARGLIENPAVLLKISLPWSLVLLALLFKPIRKGILHNRLVVFSLLVFGINFPIYWFTGELRARYIYPIIPLLCIVYAHIIHLGTEHHAVFSTIIDRLAKMLTALLTLLLFIASFIPRLNMEPYQLVINSVLVAAGIVLFVFILRKKMYQVYALVLLMALARIAMNNIYLKLYKEESQTTILKEHVSEMVDLAGGNPIGMTGSTYVYNSNVSLLGKEIISGDVEVPMILSYQVPYYYARFTGRTITFTSSPVPGNYYLILSKETGHYYGKELYRYFDMSTQNEWSLFRLTGTGNTQ